MGFLDRLLGRKGTRKTTSGADGPADAVAEAPTQNDAGLTESVLRLSAPEPVASLWSDWSAKYVITVHRDGKVRSFEDLQGKRVSCALIDLGESCSISLKGGNSSLPSIMRDAYTLIEAMHGDGALGVNNVLEAFTQNLIGNADMVGFMVPSVAQHVLSSGRGCLVQVTLG